MQEWKIYRIGDICKRVCSGGTPKSTEPSYYDGEIPWLNTKEINFNRISSTEKHITLSGLENSSAKWIDKNSVIVAMYGATAAKIAINTIPLTTNQACCNLSIDETKADYRFVYYWLYHHYTELASLANGGAQQNLNAQQIKDFEIKLPEIQTQQKIVDLLWSIDNKIICNKSINDNLELQAQTLFNYYFVENINELGEYSEGSLTDIASYLNGLAMQKFRPEGTDHGLPVLKIKELGQGSCDNASDRCSSYIKDDYIINNGDIIFSWSGTLLVDLWCGGKCGLNQHLFRVRSNKYPKWFIYFWTKHHLDQFIRVAKDKAVTMGHIKRTELDKANVLIPSLEVIEKIGATIAPMIDKLINNRVEMMELSSVRDSLLPRLMSGELEINEIDC